MLTPCQTSFPAGPADPASRGVRQRGEAQDRDDAAVGAEVAGAGNWPGIDLGRGPRRLDGARLQDGAGLIPSDKNIIRTRMTAFPRQRSAEPAGFCRSRSRKCQCYAGSSMTVMIKPSAPTLGTAVHGVPVAITISPC